MLNRDINQSEHLQKKVEFGQNNEQITCQLEPNTKIIIKLSLSIFLARSEIRVSCMINGIKPSELNVRNRSLNIHYDRLTRIINGESSCFSTFDRNFHNIVRRKKFNHMKWKHFKFNEEQEKLCKENEIVKDKIVKILSSKHKLPPSLNQSLRDFSKSNYFYEKKRFQTSIDRENPEIAKRILKATGSLDHKKDFIDFKKSRQFVKRLERFPILKRLQHSLDSSRLKLRTQQKYNHESASSKFFQPVRSIKRFY